MRRLFACLVAAAVSAQPARADLVGPLGKFNKKGSGDQPRSGPGRACGAGAGVGLAGIGATWGLTWIGFRLAGRREKR